VSSVARIVSGESASITSEANEGLGPRTAIRCQLSPPSVVL
jgi:hypothetical protein